MMHLLSLLLFTITIITIAYCSLPLVLLLLLLLLATNCFISSFFYTIAVKFSTKAVKISAIAVQKMLQERQFKNAIAVKKML